MHLALPGGIYFLVAERLTQWRATFPGGNKKWRTAFPPGEHCGLPGNASGSCRCAIIVVPWCLRSLSLSSMFLNMFLTKTSPQAKHAETDPRHGTPTMAHFQPPDCLFVGTGVCEQTHSFCPSPCPAVQQQKLLSCSSHRYYSPEEYLFHRHR